MISAILLFGKYIRRLGLAHKILDTFEKMDAINPTFELYGQWFPIKSWLIAQRYYENGLTPSGAKSKWYRPHWCIFQL